MKKEMSTTTKYLVMGLALLVIAALVYFLEAHMRLSDFIRGTLVPLAALVLFFVLFVWLFWPEEKKSDEEKKGDEDKTAPVVSSSSGRTIADEEDRLDNDLLDLEDQCEALDARIKELEKKKKDREERLAKARARI